MPKRSTGCDLCKRRGVKCDEEKPGCKRCMVYGQTCPGYSSATAGLFRHHTPETSGLFNHIQAQARAQPRRHLDTLRAAFLSRPAGNESSGPSRVELGSGRLNAEILLDNVKFSYSPGGPTEFGPWSFLWHLPPISDCEHALRTALETLSLAALVTKSADSALVLQCQELHWYSQKALLESLSKPQQSDHVVAAMLVLSFCEHFSVVSNGGSAWRSHVSGAIAYYVAQDPFVAPPGLSRHLSHSLRLHSLWIGYYERQASPFASPAWLATTHESRNVHRAIALLDLQLQIPSLQGCADVLLQTGSEIAPSRDEIHRRYGSLREQLRHWRDMHFGANSVAPISLVNVWTLRGYSQPSEAVAVFQDAMTFNSLQDALLYSQYPLAMLHMSTVARSMLSSQGPGFRSSIPGIDAQYFEEEQRHFVKEMCLCVPYLLVTHPEAYSGRIHALALLKQAQEFYFERKDWEKYRWCENLTASVARGGITGPALLANALGVTIDSSQPVR